MKVRESAKGVKGILQLVREIRPDQACNFAKADSWFLENFTKQYGDCDFQEVKDVVERSLAFHEGAINIATIFNWVRVGLKRNFLLKMKATAVSQKDFYDRS